MGNVRAGAWALILGALSFVALMAAHPSHVGGALIGPLSLSDIVHGAAFLMQPVLLYGFWVLTRFMGDRPLAQIGLCFYGLSATLTMMAATMSALVIARIVDAAHHPEAAGRAVDVGALQQFANYTVWLNRAFASVHVGLFSVAIVLWAIAWPSRTPLALLTRASGVLVGGAVIAWALSGTMTLEAGHGALLVTIAQMSWTLLAAAALLGARAKDPSPAP